MQRFYRDFSGVVEYGSGKRLCSSVVPVSEHKHCQKLQKTIIFTLNMLPNVNLQPELLNKVTRRMKDLGIIIFSENAKYNFG